MKAYAAPFLAAGLVALPVASLAQPAVPVPDVTPPTYSRTATDADAHFTFALLEEARTQLALAQLAQARAASPATQALARQTASEWRRLQGRLQSIAYTQGLPTPGQLDEHGRQQLDTLGRTPPAQFDAAYTALVSGVNQRVAAMMEAERRSSNPALVALVNDFRGRFPAAASPASTPPPQQAGASNPDE